MRRSIYPNGSGGGTGDFVSLNTFNTYAELDAQAAEDGNLGLVASGTEGEPRLFRYATDTWVPDEPVVWTIATTGAGVMSGLIDAAGAAVYPGDLGVDGNATIYYAVGAAGRCFFMPRALTGGIVVGETHTASIAGAWYKEDPATAADVTDISTGDASVSFDSGTGKTTLQATSTGTAQITLGTAPIDSDVIYSALLGATWAGNRSGFEGLWETRTGASSPYDRIQALAEASSVYSFGASGAIASITGADADVEHDIAYMWDGTTQRAYYNSPDPSQDDAVPAPDASGSGTPTTAATGGWATIFVANADASTPSLVCDGAYTIALTAIP